MPQIHPTAIVAPGAMLAQDVVIGPYCVVGDHVTLDSGLCFARTWLLTVARRSELAREFSRLPRSALNRRISNIVGKNSALVIGRNNRIREYVTMNPGTTGGGMITRVGDDCLFMVGAHIAHDCRIADHVIMANNATLAGHVTH